MKHVYIFFGLMLGLPFTSLSQCNTITCQINGPTSINACTNSPVALTATCSGNWVANGTLNLGTGNTLSYIFTTVGTYNVTVQYQTPVWVNELDGPGYCTTQLRNTGIVRVQVFASPVQPTVASNKSSICTGDANNSVTLTVTNPQAGTTYSWTSDPAGYTATGTSPTFSDLLRPTTFTVAASNTRCSARTPVYVDVVATLATAQLHPKVFYHKRQLLADPANIPGYYWQTTATGTATNFPTSQPFYATVSGSYYIRRFDPQRLCWAKATEPLNVSVTTTPPLAEVVQIKDYGYNQVYFANTDRIHIFQFADYYWVSDATVNATSVAPYNNQQNVVGDKRFASGTYYLRGRDRETGTWGPTLTLNVQLANVDNSLNWVFTRSFDGTKDAQGNLTVLGESKSYFDQRGQALQSQTKSFHKVTENNVIKEVPFVFASQSLKDKYDRTVGGTLSAPILQNDFLYNAAFAQNDQGNVLSYADFDKAQPLATDQKGTLGNYFSAQNAWGETQVPQAKRLFSRTDFYEDGSGEERKSAQPGDTHFIGSGKEVVKGTFPVGNHADKNELTEYLDKRYFIFKKPEDPVVPTTRIKIEGVQTVVRDENGRFAVSISDKSGKVLMTARKGGNEATPCSISSDKMAYFYVMGTASADAQQVTINGTGSYTIENTLTNAQVDKITGALPHVYTLPSGFYRVLPSIGTVQVSYAHYFTDIAYQFYNDAGRLVSSVSPNGYEQWRDGASYDNIDKSTHVYNHQGWLMSMTETDAGETNYKYRKDGKIRFSQNALQKENETKSPGKGRFSYTNYDKLGRPVESGEYIGTALTFATLTQLEFANQGTYSNTEKKDWVTTYYDMPGPSAGVSSFVQNYVRGAVSWTENASNRTWYSYDEMGRVTAMVQSPKQLPLKFLTQYEYDFLGNVLTTSTRAIKEVNGTNVEQDIFYHHYEYDRNKRLTKASTSRDGVKKTVQAEYFYYLHGPLKRVVLASKLQGIDFIYNIHGWLTQINHPDDSNVNNDPGKDSPASNGVRKDVFGMILEYYEHAMMPMTTGSIYDPLQFHRVPSINDMETTKKTLVASATDPISLYKESMRQSAAALQAMPGGGGR
ncbi:MAG: hypothetical protein ACKO96_49575 [Flammeovirgaceae bacterium]